MRPARTERLVGCPLCAADFDPICQAHDRLHGEGRAERFPVARCRSCGLVFLSVRPHEEEMGRYYPEEYAPYKRRRRRARRRGPLRRRFHAWAQTWKEELTGRVDRWTGNPVAERCAALYRQPGAGRLFLDFGCGSPKVLDRMRAQGWETLGLDLSPGTVARIRERGHRALLVGPGLWDEIPSASLDLVRMNHVLEHLHRPRETLAALRERLRPEGLVHVALPNPRSVSFGLFRARWLGLDCPRHLLLPPPEVLRGLVREVGFGGVEVLHEVVTKDFLRSAGYLLRDLGLMSREQVMELTDRPLLNAWCYPSARLAALAGRSDRYHAFLRREGP